MKNKCGKNKCTFFWDKRFLNRISSRTWRLVDGAIAHAPAEVAIAVQAAEGVSQPRARRHRDRAAEVLGFAWRVVVRELHNTIENAYELQISPLLR